MKFEELSPLHHSCCLERLKKHAFLCCNVYAIARRLAKPCIKIAPVSTSCAMATTSPFLSYFNPSRNVFVSGVSGATSEAFVSASSSAFFAAAVHLPTDDVVLDAVLPPHRPLLPEAFASQVLLARRKKQRRFAFFFFAFAGGPSSPKENTFGRRKRRCRRRQKRRHLSFFFSCQSRPNVLFLRRSSIKGRETKCDDCIV